MKKGLSVLVGMLGIASLYPATALAHPGLGLASGFGHGLSHPLLGLDHLLAMVAVGLLAVQMGGRAVWILPCTFVVFMIFGGGLAIAGIHLPHVEAGIMASLLVLGLLLATAFRLPMALTVFIIAVFAVFHGHAHGSEMPLSAGAVTYSIGFALTTSMLHMVGVVLGKGVAKVRMESVLRLAGGAITISGLYMAFT